jgi:asparagine synthase (glutamine-hydrolysing)
VIVNVLVFDFCCLVFKFDEDYAFEMHSKFSLAVKSRMVVESKSGLFLSSGLDSTAVASYLSTNLELNHKSLHTYTSYPYYTNIIQESKRNMIDETKLVKEFTNSYPAIIPEYLNFPKTDIIEMIHKCYDGHPDFMELNINTFWMNGIFEKAKNDKVKIIFSGQMGNYVITWYEQYKLLNMFFKARFISLIEEIFRLAKVQEKNFFMIIKSEILSEFFHRVIINFKNIFSRPSKIFKPHLVRSGIISKDSWGKELKEVMFIPVVTYYKNYSSRVVRKIVFNRSNTTTGLSWYKSGHLHAMNCVDPTRDERLVNYAFSIPEAIYNLFGQKKYIYKLWMKYKIPDQILNATTKSFQSADISSRISSKKNFDSLMHKIRLEWASTIMIDQKHFENLIYRFSSNKNLMKKRLVLAELLSIVSMVSIMKNKKV